MIKSFVIKLSKQRMQAIINIIDSVVLAQMLEMTDFLTQLHLFDFSDLNFIKALKVPWCTFYMALLI